MIIATEMCPGRVYIYPYQLGHTLKSFASIGYGFSIRSKREGDSVRGSLIMVPLYHRWFQKGPKSYW
jgi:hypothetical protein